VPKKDFTQVAHDAFKRSLGLDAAEPEPAYPDKPKDAAAVELGRKGGKARAAKMTAEQRKEAAKKAVTARWHKTA
jgi:hypothetical protein